MGATPDSNPNRRDVLGILSALPFGGSFGSVLKNVATYMGPSSGLAELMKELCTGLAEDLVHNPEHVVSAYQAWRETGETKHIRSVLEQAGLLKKNDPLNHGTWKRLIHESKERTRAVRRVDANRIDIMLAARDLMHQPFEMYEDLELEDMLASLRSLANDALRKKS